MAVAGVVIVTWAVLHILDVFDHSFDVPILLDVISGSVLLSLFPGAERIIRAFWGKNGNGS